MTTPATPAERTADPVADAVGASARRRALAWRDLGPTEVANGFVGWLFAASAPVTVILTSGRQGNLSEAQIASWIFGVFVGTLAAAFVGSVCSCLTGPTNGILTSSGARERHRMAALVFGTLAIAFGLFSPMLTRVLLHAPPAFVATLAGLALVRVIQTAFVTAFKDRFILGAVTTFLVTVADRPLLGIGAPFWGLVAGMVVAGVLERKDFR